MNAAVAVTVFWLLIDIGTAKTPPVFVPEPFETIEDCNAAGEAFKESKLDYMEAGLYVCIPQKVSPT